MIRHNEVLEAQEKHHAARLAEEVGAGVRFERVRRITGYLVGTADRFNNAKQAELKDRRAHGHE